MPTFVVAFLLFKADEVPRFSFTTNLLLVFMVFLTTFIIPCLSLLTMKLTKNIPSLQMRKKEERLLPFGMVSAFFLLATYLFSTKQELDPTIILALFLITACIIILTGITFFWKISAHMTGAAGLMGFILYGLINNSQGQLLPLFLISMILVGAVGSSRLYLNAHTPGEILGGFILGFSVCYTGMWFWL
jgi:membrane-associated phospholipid phosphatase